MSTKWYEIDCTTKHITPLAENEYSCSLTIFQFTRFLDTKIFQRDDVKDSIFEVPSTQLILKVSVSKENDIISVFTSYNGHNFNSDCYSMKHSWVEYRPEEQSLGNTIPGPPNNHIQTPTNNTKRKRKQQLMWHFIRSFNIPELKTPTGIYKNLILRFLVFVSNNKALEKITNKMRIDFENLLLNGTYSDVILKSANGTAFRAHKIILSARNAVLENLSKHDIIETIWDEEILNDILLYIYTGKTKLKENPGKMIPAADFYNLDELKSLCFDSIQENLSVENAIETLELALLYSNDKLKNHTLKFIADGRIPDVTETTGWCNIKSDTKQMVLEFETPNQPTQFIIVKKSNSTTDTIRAYENLLRTGAYSDVVMKSTQGHELRAHKTILSARSTILKAHFEHESLPDTVTTSWNTQTLKCILFYIYTGKTIWMTDTSKLLAAADFYQLDELKILCFESIQDNLSVENAIETLELALLYSNDKLKNHILEFIADGRITEVIKTTGWFNLKCHDTKQMVFELSASKCKCFDYSDTFYEAAIEMSQKDGKIA